jgi:hypothetical protein
MWGAIQPGGGCELLTCMCTHARVLCGVVDLLTRVWQVALGGSRGWQGCVVLLCWLLAAVRALLLAAV